MESNTAALTDLEAYVAGTAGTVHVQITKTLGSCPALAFSFSKAISNSMQ